MKNSHHRNEEPGQKAGQRIQDQILIRCLTRALIRHKLSRHFFILTTCLTRTRFDQVYDHFAITSRRRRFFSPPL